MCTSVETARHPYFLIPCLPMRCCAVELQQMRLHAEEQTVAGEVAGCAFPLASSIQFAQVQGQLAEVFRTHVANARAAQRAAINLFDPGFCPSSYGSSCKHGSRALHQSLVLIIFVHLIMQTWQQGFASFLGSVHLHTPHHADMPTGICMCESITIGPLTLLVTI
eukprot:1158098-Pelagomonas_calceolata.AAC.8